MLNIKIFSSHRIDRRTKPLNSKIIIPIRCGAFFDKSNSPLIGDNTGDNISHKRLPYCEATVEYWAWKNCNCDYIGLCHYRRFLAFAPSINGKRNCFNQLEILRLSSRAIKKYSLIDDEQIERLCTAYDIIVPEEADIETIDKELRFGVRTVEQLWLHREGVYFDKGCLEFFKAIIEEDYPELYESAVRYLSGSSHRGFNCFVFRSDIFDDFCQKQFEILRKLENRMAFKKRFPRDLGYFTEIFFGVYTQYLIDKGFRCKFQPIVFVINPSETILSIMSMRSFLVFSIKKILPKTAISFLKQLLRGV